MLIRACVFDADGVVLLPRLFSTYLEQHYALPLERTRDFFYGALEECILGRANLREVLPPFLTAWELPHSVDEFLLEWFAYGDAVDQRMLDSIATLRRRGIICCLATNQEHHRIQYMRTAMGFDRVFDAIFYAAAIGHKKTDPEFFDHVEQQLGLSGNTILLWDDARDNVDAARESGWHAELYVTFEAFQRALDDYLESPVSDILSAE